MNDNITSSQQDLYITLGKRIQEARQRTPLTQAQLAAALGLSRTSVTNIENGRQQILVHTLYAIATALRVDLHTLLPEAESNDIDTVHFVPKGVTQDEWRYIKPLVVGTKKMKHNQRAGEERKNR